MYKLVLIILIIFSVCFAQDDQNEIEVFLIDSYVTTKTPPKFILSFFTSDSCKSKIMIDGKYEIEVASKLTDEHKLELDISEYSFSGQIISYDILVSKDQDYKIADKIELPLNFDIKEVQEMNYSLFNMCCIGGAIFGMPYPTYINVDGKDYFAVTKEIAFLTFSGSDFNYPNGYIGAEYAHIFGDAEVKNILRIGYKQIFTLPLAEYISPGISGFTDFNGNNGISTEISVGFVKVSSIFTLYGRYRYNFVPVKNGLDFQEFTIGLYSSFFSINL